jgi:multicomponent Na+:H+ antiporter subunit C
VVVYILCFGLFLIGIYGLLSKKNLIKIIISMNLIGYAVNLFFILIAYRHDGLAPVLETSKSVAAHTSAMVDPIPQGLVATSVIIELALTILLISLALGIYAKYKTFDITKIRRLKG